MKYVVVWGDAITKGAHEPGRAVHDNKADADRHLTDLKRMGVKPSYMVLVDDEVAVGAG